MAGATQLQAKGSEAKEAMERRDGWSSVGGVKSVGARHLRLGQQQKVRPIQSLLSGRPTRRLGVAVNGEDVQVRLGLSEVPDDALPILAVVGSVDVHEEVGLPCGFAK